MELDLKSMKTFMLKRCWSIAELTRRAGLSNTTLYKIMHGENNASPQTIGKIAKALDVNPEEILKDN